MIHSRDKVLRSLANGPLTFDAMRALYPTVPRGRVVRMEEAGEIERVPGSDPVQWRLAKKRRPERLRRSRAS